MSDIHWTTKTTVHKTITLTDINGQDIIKGLRQVGYPIPHDVTAKVTVRVPGGGDWSNTTLNLDEDTVTVTWETINETSQDEDS